MQWVILIGIGIVWLFSSIFSGVSNTVSDVRVQKKNKEDFNNKRAKKYADRIVNPSESIFDRNQDIIEVYIKKVNPDTSESNYSYSRRYSYKNYYFENLTRDCINEICLAENQFSIYPDTAYLSDWKMKVSTEWANLAQQIQNVLEERKEELLEEKRVLAEEAKRAEDKAKRAQQQINREKLRATDEVRLLRSRKNQRKDPLSLRKIQRRKTESDIDVDDVVSILKPNLITWIEQEKELMSSKKEAVVQYPLFTSSVDFDYKFVNDEIEDFNKTLQADAEARKKNKEFFVKIYEGYKKGLSEDVSSRINFVMDNLVLPTSIPNNWNADFSNEEGIAIVEIMLPDVVHRQVYKTVSLKSGNAKKPLTQKEKLEKVPAIHPAIILRVAYEIFRNDTLNVIKLLVVNGWVEFDNPATGLKTKTYTASLVVDKDKIKDLNLGKLDPLSAFGTLKGKSAGKLIDIIPVSPVMSLDRKDKRFIETKEVLSKMDTQTNLASMDWQDFENLIAELFQKEFSEEGTEIKLTQSSRDKGVDAIVFNPDPIRGGKYVIQAKRYTNTVDVSAVRDLVAVVAHEGASRGILVTTSTFGADAYAFVQNKPITLLDGSKLLGLLEKHGYKFRVNLAEARKLFPNNQKY